MGSSKPLLPWFGATLVERQVEALLRAGVDIVCVVTGYRGDEVAAAVGGSALFTDALLNGDRRVVMAHNPNFKDGKTTSIRAGLAALPTRLGAIAVLAVDQPRPASVTLRVLESHAASGRPATSPRFDGHGGHPLVFDGALMPELEAVSEAKEGLREVMRRHAQQINWVPFDDPIVRLDLNTPDAYQAALKTFPDPRPSR
ncbi:MAG: nucleotidyltransferase family protein [Dehalococcoidia bacterium]|nr:nucleotidyltransferase family protein [Dehalococcoidia bacterium]MSQ35156.1 nucleotidyltransferase family protein [Dehalococcoidia bacterium]